MAMKQASLFDLFDTPPEAKPDEKELNAQEVGNAVGGVSEVSEVEEVSKVEEVSEVAEVSEGEEAVDAREEAVDEKLLEENYIREAFVLEDAIQEPIIEFSIIPDAKKEPAKERSVVVKERKSTRGRMKLSDMNAGVDLIEIPEDSILFEKRYYSIGTVSEMFKVNISLIRFWENEFDILKPKKNGKGDRHFRPEDIKNLQLIYHLLREKKYTIEGAKEFLKKNKKSEETFAVIESLKKMKSFLNELKAGL